ncbi:Mariner Mos1 transposase [Araneus ventricosus]|uniref:Mariner Mos1 transposase n=1 Tax=Araneus ventricosus TaxID=182803 RepID=A0A4Y2SBY8_ARAVE|nr:Mariner Mos1 transposase [Araneus ventricosus]
MRRNTAFCRILSLVTKHGITTLNQKASVRASSGNMRLHHLQRNQRPCSSGKVMISFLFDHEGPLLVELLERGTTINAQRYQATLQNVKRAINSKWIGMLSNSVILLHDNARPHTANAGKTSLQQFQRETLEHPPYSPDLSPCDFHVFGPLKQAIRRHRFPTDDEVCVWVQAWVRKQPISFFKDGIDRLVSQWDKCANSFGDYF